MDMKNIKVYGRSKNQGGKITADWTCSGIEFCAECEGNVFITVHSTSAQKLYFSVFVDGVKTRLCINDFPSSNNEYKVLAAATLEKGIHNIKFIRQSEAERGCAEICDISLCGTLLARPADGKALIEFVGDSITCGYANLASCDMPPQICSESPYEDGTAGYAFLTATALGYDYSMISRQGTGIVAGWDYLTNPMGAIPRVYSLLSFYRDRNENYNPERKADIIVINLGTNDIYKFLSNEREPALSEADFINRIYTVLCDIYDFNCGPKMVVAIGMMTNKVSHAPLYRWYDEAIARFERDKGVRIHFCSLPENYDGGKAHPSVEGHRAAAEVLTKFIKEL